MGSWTWAGATSPCASTLFKASISLFSSASIITASSLVQGLVTPAVYHLRMTPPTILNALGSIRRQRHGTHRQRPAPRRDFRHQPAAFDECAAHRPRRSCRLVEPPRTQEHSAGRGLRIHDAVGKSNFGLLYDTCHGSDGTTSTPVICRGRPDPD